MARTRRLAGSAGRATAHWARGSARTGRGRVLLALVVVLAVVVPSGAGLALASVLGDGDGGAAGERVATIGVMAPLSGASSEAGTAALNAVRLAVEEANAQHAIPGWKLEVVAHDDLSRADGGAAGADVFADDDRMIGVVGPLSSSVAMVSLPRLSEAGLPVISPSNAEPTLTMPEREPDTRPYPTYFRLSGTDEVLAEAAADYAVHTLGRTRISVVDGGPDYGTITLAERFARHARDSGATVPTVHRADGASTDETELKATAKAIRDEAPDLVYLATGAAFAAELRNALADENVAVQVLGADGLLDPEYVERSESSTDGDVISDLSVALSQLPAAGAFVEAYTERFGGPVAGSEALLPDGSPTGIESSPTTGEAGDGSASSSRPPGSSRSTERDGATSPDGSGDPERGGGGGGSPDEAERVRREQAAALARLRADAIPPAAAYAYDAARALIRSAAMVLPGRLEINPGVRETLVRTVGEGNFAGITGQVSFDERGDARHPEVALYSVLGGRFVPLRVVSN